MLSSLIYIFISLSIRSARELATDGTGYGQGGVNISVVGGWVGLKHGNGETNTSVLVHTVGVEWVGSVGSEASKERSLKTSNGDALIGSLNHDRVGE